MMYQGQDFHCYFCLVKTADCVCKGQGSKHAFPPYHVQLAFLERVALCSKGDNLVLSKKRGEITVT